MVIKHPKANEEPRVFSFEDYYDPLNDDDETATSANENTTSETPNTTTNIREENERLPWRPFRSRLDFELAELMQGANLNRGEIEILLGIINRIIDAPSQFSITSFTDLTKAWTLARDVNVATGVSVLSINNYIPSWKP